MVGTSLSLIYFFYSLISFPVIAYAYLHVNDGVTDNTSKLYICHSVVTIIWGLAGFAGAVYALIYNASDEA